MDHAGAPLESEPYPEGSPGRALLRLRGTTLMPEIS